MKKLSINWFDLEMAFENLSGEDSYLSEIANYFDKETGRVVVLSDDTRDAMSSIVDDLDEMIDDGADWTTEDICCTSSYQALPDWMKESVLAAIQVEYGTDDDRFEPIPQFDSHEAFEWMESFAESVNDNSMRDRLSAALSGRKPFRNFRDAIGSDRRLEQQWHVFESSCRRKAIIEWLHSIDVEPVNPEDSTYDPPALPELRKIMFAEVRRFVRFARDVPGVLSIGLIGSLASDKEFPNDIDLLLTITDDCDLTELARLGRQLAGHMNSHSAGADVFLANPTNTYLGRTCPWKRCGPGNRARCDAQSCGARRYLHDDFGAIQLSEDLIQHPPATLWPKPTAISAVPADVHEQLLEPLSLDPQR